MAAELPGAVQGQLLEIGKQAHGQWGCHFAGCTECAIGSHTIQRAALKRISKGGKVYWFEPSVSEALKGGRVEPVLVGIKQASTFTGFCAHHDNEVFEPIECRDLHFDERSAFLFGYRAVCHHLYVRRVMLKMWESTQSSFLARAPSEMKAVAREDFQRGIRLVRESLKLTRRIKAEYEDTLSAANFGRVHFACFQTEGTPPIACCGLHAPLYDFKGSRIGKAADFKRPVDTLTFTMLPAKLGGRGIFCWIHDEKKGCTAFLSSLLLATKDEEVLNPIARFVYEYLNENTYFSPKWWTGLSAAQKDAVRRRVTTARGPGHPHNPLTPDAIKIQGLGATEWETNHDALRELL